MKKGILSLLIMVTALMVASSALAAPASRAALQTEVGQSQSGVYLDDGVIK